MINRQNDYSLTSRVYPGDYSISEFLTRDNTSMKVVLWQFCVSVMTVFVGAMAVLPCAIYRSTYH